MKLKFISLMVILLVFSFGFTQANKIVTGFGSDIPPPTKMLIEDIADPWYADLTKSDFGDGSTPVMTIYTNTGELYPPTIHENVEFISIKKTKSGLRRSSLSLAFTKPILFGNYYKVYAIVSGSGILGCDPTEPEGISDWRPFAEFSSSGMDTGNEVTVTEGIEKGELAVANIGKNSTNDFLYGTKKPHDICFFNGGYLYDNISDGYAIYNVMGSNVANVNFAHLSDWGFDPVNEGFKGELAIAANTGKNFSLIDATGLLDSAGLYSGDTSENMVENGKNKYPNPFA